METKATKALEMMKLSQSVEQKAGNFVTSIKRNLQKKVIDVLQEKKERLDDELTDLGNFNLKTDINAGQKELTREDCENRFKRIMEIEYELTLLEAELKAKRLMFAKYFE